MRPSLPVTNTSRRFVPRDDSSGADASTPSSPSGLNHPDHAPPLLVEKRCHNRSSPPRTNTSRRPAPHDVIEGSSFMPTGGAPSPTQPVNTWAAPRDQYTPLSVPLTTTSSRPGTPRIVVIDGLDASTPSPRSSCAGCHDAPAAPVRAMFFLNVGQSAGPSAFGVFHTHTR